MKRSLRRYAFFAASLLFACRHGENRSELEARPSSTASASMPLADAGPKRLPEDPVEARKATAQWHEHLLEEERERKQLFDRGHEKEHEAVLSALQKSRARYDAAKTKAQVLAAQSAFRSSLLGLKKTVLAIDPDRQSSNLQADYDSMLETLDTAYPEALVASFAGDQKALVALRADLDGRVAKARAWLSETERNERE